MSIWKVIVETDQRYDSMTGEPRIRTSTWVRTVDAEDSVALMCGENQSDNARLIAAAPEILEALKDSPCGCEYDHDKAKILWECRRCKVIARAEGRE